MPNNINDTRIEKITTDTLLNVLDYSSDEIYVLNNELQIIYVNKVCERHYGLKPNEVIGQHNEIFLEKGYWTPSIVPIVLNQKKQVTIEQTTHTGKELITTAVPILNPSNHEVDLIFITARQKNYVIHYQQSNEKNDAQNVNESFSNSFITNDEKMDKIIRFCKKIAPLDTNVLIQGESGTGKGVLANYIHQISHRKNGSFLAVNCAAIPEDLLESELFGYSQGAFTGAMKNGKIGLLETANKGTIFLDEIGEISPRFQAKLLQVIQERSFFPVGGRELRKVDVRIITATNRDLIEMVRNNQFREDLYYRFNVIDVHIPPLRERKEDIVLLTNYFLDKFNKKYQLNCSISDEVLSVLTSYSWPGNVRQLENTMERLVVTSDSIIQLEDLPDPIFQTTHQHSVSSEVCSLDKALEEIEKNLIISSYQKHKSSRKVAKDLSISQTKATKLIRKYCN